jgi:hypothetical protein
MKIDKAVSKQAFHRGWRIQFNAGKNRVKLVELVTLPLDESRKAEHVRKQNERRLEWLRHRILARGAFPGPPSAFRLANNVYMYPYKNPNITNIAA